MATRPGWSAPGGPQQPDALAPRSAQPQDDFWSEAEANSSRRRRRADDEAPLEPRRSRRSNGNGASGADVSVRPGGRPSAAASFHDEPRPDHPDAPGKGRVTSSGSFPGAARPAPPLPDPPPGASAPVHHGGRAVVPAPQDPSLAAAPGPDRNGRRAVGPPSHDPSLAAAPAPARNGYPDAGAGRSAVGAPADPTLAGPSGVPGRHEAPAGVSGGAARNGGRGAVPAPADPTLAGPSGVPGAGDPFGGAAGPVGEASMGPGAGGRRGGPQPAGRRGGPRRGGRPAPPGAPLPPPQGPPLGGPPSGRRPGPPDQARRTPPAAAGRGRRPPSSSGQRPAQRKDPKSQWARLAPVYDVDGPRIRLGILWFVVGMPAILASTYTTAILFAVVAGMAARQTVMAWKAEQWQADAAAGLAAAPVLVAVFGPVPAIAILVVACIAALGVGFSAPSAGLSGGVGLMASAGIMLQATAPVALAGAAMVTVRGELVAAAAILFVFACAYEMGDYLVGSGSSNAFEGPLAGGAAVVVTGFPLALLLIEPFDVMGVWTLGVFAACCPVGQWIASAVLPSPGAHAPALRRMDTLLLLAPLWAIAVGVF